MNFLSIQLSISRKVNLPHQSRQPRLLFQLVQLHEEADMSDMETIVSKLRDPESLAVGNRTTLCGFSIFAGITPAEKAAIVLEASTDTQLDRAMGSMVGMAVIDAFGHMFEFLPAVDQPFSSGHGFSLQRFKDPTNPGEACFQHPLNKFQLSLGQWTDDASMGSPPIPHR